ncbi:MAG: type I methionyl aminopeptidase [Candidatus Levybacteria bacterium RIFCSPHIGHO2_02_FULL_42_12]|nr:MAG: type I methionyl aminopeptidase [Candidatus Levybacteria bacterium RIFCSPHIGHO2_01_FULL_42_15]OGH31431.1 MAG: type I methionyl aminopeptidase [Candidatus Levybacteria bacterium RIFCSPHIGHO2_02_FULL_42_12]OGH42695.1 MAG: type I methionyl aminopeptidase [Candidatus Levybacteria bacterium RIFCSPLOWO2_01_FULL_42_15]
MIDIKTQEEIEVMAKGGKILSDVLREVLKHVKPGVSGLKLDLLAEKLIVQKGGEPGFKKVKNYKHALCVCVNDVVVHGIPTDYKFKEGDLVTIDCGVYYKGFHTDSAHTVRVQRSGAGKVQNSDEVDRFLETGKKALEKAIKVARVGNRIGHISKTIQDVVEGAGYSVVRSLIGHGVGRNLHEEPEIPGFLEGPIEETPLLKEGMTIAIEVIYNRGKPDVVYANSDGWTIKTKDGSLSGVFERTVAITEKGSVVLTK